MATSSLEILRALEDIALHDPIETLQAAALETLRAPVHREFQWRHRTSTYHSQVIQTQIKVWQSDKLITPQQANVLRERYPFETTSSKKQKTETAQEAPRSLKDMLLSEATMKIALYLGAFFVIAAAFIFAIVIESARVPILTLVVFAGFATALVLFKRLSPVSFVFFAIGSLLIPIDAWVIMDLNFTQLQSTDLYWMVVCAVMAMVWFGGTYLYRSRLFSVLGLWASTASAFLLADIIHGSAHANVLLVAIPTLGALGCSYYLRRLGDKVLFRPLFLAAQVQQFLLLAFSVGLSVTDPPDGNLPERLWWLGIALTWLLGTGFYTASYALTKFKPFPLLAVGVLLPVPLFAASVFDPGIQVLAVVAWVWGLGLAFSGQVSCNSSRDYFRTFWPYLYGGSAAIYTLAALLGISELIGLGIGLLVGTSLVYLGLVIWQHKTFPWSASLVAALWAYLAVFTTEPLKVLEIPSEFIMLVPACIFLGGELAARRLQQVSGRWFWPLRILGLLVAGLSTIFAFLNGIDTPWNAVINFVILAAFATFYTLWDGRASIGFAATTSLGLAIPYIVLGLEWDHWLVLVYGLAACYWVVGTALDMSAKGKGWSLVLRISGLALGTAGALSAAFQGGALSILGTAFIASFFVIEGFRLRNVWLGFPANLLYLGAYFMALVELEVSEPQYFSIGAALLGIVMHYLLVRSKNYLAATITGVIAQLILLNTTYIQMIANDEFIFFFIIFLQSLVLLVYGLVVRSKSFVITPLIFVVVSVVTVAFSVLSGISTIIMIGCTGVILLILGIVALLMRERINKTTMELGDKLGGWRG